MAPPAPSRRGESNGCGRNEKTRGMPGILARRDDGALLVAVGHAGLIVHPDGFLPVLREHMRVSMVSSLLARSGWEQVNEPVPPGLVTEEHIAALREYDRHQMETAPRYDRELLEETRPDTGD